MFSYQMTALEDKSDYLPIHQIHRKHTQMFVKELDIPIINSLRDLFANLVRTTPLNHI